MVIYGSCVDKNLSLVPGFRGYDSTGAVIEYVTLGIHGNHTET
jgi:hypothetical protein